MNLRIIIKTILFISVCLLIFFFSSENGNQSEIRSMNFIYLLFNIDVNDIERIETINFIIRKLAHFSIYFLLGFISSSLLKEFNFSLKKIIYISLIFCFLYACSDELHLLFISDRYGSINDVFIDFSGAFFGSLIYNYIIYRFKFCRRYL